MQLSNSAFSKEDITATNISEVTIEDILGDIGDDKLVFQIVKGELIYVGDDQTEIENCAKYGITLSPVVMDENNIILGTMDFAGTGKTYVVPETAVAISSNAFYGDTSLEYLDFSSNTNITEIPSYAFYKCTNLKEINFGSTITSIGSDAFMYCSSITEIKLPNSVESISTHGFTYCSKLEKVTLPINDKFTVLNSNVFLSTAIVSIEIPDSVKTIYSGAFKSCTKLESVVIGKDLTTINETSFSGTTSLKNITISDSNTTLASYENCVYSNDYKSLYIIPSGTTELKLHEDLTDIVTKIPTTIEIEKLVIGSKVEALPNLNSNTNIEEIEINQDNAYLTEIDGVIYNKNKTQILTALGNVTEVICDENTTSIETSAFEGNLSITKIDMSTSDIVTIGYRGFFNCKNLSEVIFSEELETINAQVFYYNSSLTEINLPNSVKTINSLSFYGCTKLESINIPSTVTTLINPFTKCTSLTQIILDEENGNYKLIDGNIYSKDETQLIVVLNFSEDMVIKEGVTTISTYAMSYSSIVKTIELPSTITTISSNAFNSLTNLEKINIPNGIESIATSVFSNCTSLKAINIDLPENAISGAPWGASLRSFSSKLEWIKIILKYKKEQKC